MTYRLRSYFTNFRIKAKDGGISYQFLKKKHRKRDASSNTIFNICENESGATFRCMIPSLNMRKNSSFFHVLEGGAGNRNFSDAKKGQGINKFMKTKIIFKYKLVYFICL